MDSTSKHNELIDLAVKKLSGEATSAELEKLNQLTTDGDLMQLYLELEKTWNESHRAKGLTHEDTATEWKRLQTVIRQEKSGSGFSFLQIAASIVVVIGIALALFLAGSDDQTKLLASQTTVYTLSDGTEVTLRANSELRFTEGFSAEKREVFLKGEAYFDVTHAPERPFIVHSDPLDVTVVGTSFTVSADKPSPEVVVTSGSVRVTHGEQQVSLLPGDRAIFSNNELLANRNEDPNFLSWKTLDFTFQDTPLRAVVDHLNNAFQADIRIDDQVANCIITVSFEGQSLKEILSVLEATLGLSAKNVGNGLLISGPGC